MCVFVCVQVVFVFNADAFRWRRLPRIHDGLPVNPLPAEEPEPVVAAPAPQPQAPQPAPRQQRQRRESILEQVLRDILGGN